MNYIADDNYKRISNFEKWWDSNNLLIGNINTKKELARFVWDNKPAKTSAEYDNNYTQLFEDIWGKYPKKINKAGSYAIWKELCKTNDELFLRNQILIALEWQVKSQQWTNEGGKYIQNPENYLKNKRWEDEAPSCVAQAEQAKERYLDFNGVWRER